MRRLLGAVVAIVCLAAGLGPASAQQRDAPTAGSAGIGDPYFPRFGNGGYDVVHYGVHNRIKIAAGRVVGRTVVRARATQSLKSFNLDLMLNVDAVTVNGRKARFSKPNRHELRVTPRTPIAAGETFRAQVSYRGHPGRFRWRGDDVWMADRTEVVAMGEPQIAAWWFPSNDHPRDKARFDIHIKVAKGQQAVANGRLKKVTRRKHTTSWHWRAEEPMAPYLAFFAAGRFTLESGRTSSGLPYTYAVSKGLSRRESRQAWTLMRRTPKVLAFLEKWLGPYPFSVTGGLTTSLDVGFALENQTRPTYPAVGTATWLVAHELAHQWFGDKVAVMNWRDIWLNEGFASYMEVLWADNWGEATPQDWLLASWWTVPARSSYWKVPIGDPGANRLFDSAVYDRGAMTVQALRHRIGTGDFKRLIRAWLSDREHGSIADFTALAEQISGQDLDGFFHAWLYAPVRPAKTAENGLR